MTKLDSKFIEAELVKYVSVGDEYPHLTVAQVDVDGKHLTCFVTFSGTEESFKKAAIESGIIYYKHTFAAARSGTSYFRGLVKEVIQDTTWQISEWGSDAVKRELEDMFFDAVTHRAVELNAAGELGFTEEEIGELTVSVVLDSVNAVTVDTDDALAYHDAIKENGKGGDLEDWMVASIDFSHLEDKVYDEKYKVALEVSGLTIDYNVYFADNKPIDLNTFSMKEIRGRVFGEWVDTDRWSEFTNPETESGRVAALADFFAGSASANYCDGWGWDDLSTGDVYLDIVKEVRSAIEANNEKFTEDGEGYFEDEINVTEADKVEVLRRDFDERVWNVFTSDNLIDWRNEYVESGEADDYEDWVRADKRED